MTNGMASADSLRELSTDITGRIVENKVDSGIPNTPVKESEIIQAKEQLGYDDDNPPTEYDQINRAYYAGKNTGISEVRANPSEGVFLRSQSSDRNAESLAARQELSSKSNPSDITRSNFERTIQSINTNPLASDFDGDLTSFSDLAAKKASLERLESAAGRVTGPGNPTISEALKNGGDGPLDLDIDQANRMLGMKSETLNRNRIEEADGIKTEVHKVLDNVEEVKSMLSAFLRPNVEVPSLEMGKRPESVPVVNKEGRVEQRVLDKLMRDVRSSNMSDELKVPVYLHIHERLRQVAEAEALPALKFVNENVYYLSTKNARTLETAKNSIATNLSLSLISGQMGASEALLASQILGLDPFIVFRSLDKDKESVHKKAREANKTVSEYLAENYVNPVGPA